MGNIFSCSNNRNSIDVTVLFVFIVIDDAADFCVHLITAFVKLAYNRTPCFACPDDHCILDLSGYRCRCCTDLQHPEDPVGKPNTRDQDILQDSTHHIIGNRHSLEYDGCPYDMECHGNGTHNTRPGKFIKTRKPPHTPIQFKGKHQDQCAGRMDWNVFHPCSEIVIRYIRKPEIKSEPQSQSVGHIHHDNVIDKQ